MALLPQSWRDREDAFWVLDSSLHHRLQSVIITVFVILLVPACHLHKFRSYRFLSTLLGAHFSTLFKWNPTPYLWMSSLHIQCMHSPNYLLNWYPYIYMVGEPKAGHKRTRFSTGAERNQKCTEIFNLWSSPVSGRTVFPEHYTKCPESHFIQHIIRMHTNNCKNLAARAQKWEMVQWVIVVQWYILKCIINMDWMFIYWK